MRFSGQITAALVLGALAGFTSCAVSHFRSIWSHWDGGEEVDRMEMDLARISD